MSRVKSYSYVNKRGKRVTVKAHSRRNIGVGNRKMSANDRAHARKTARRAATEPGNQPKVKRPKGGATKARKQNKKKGSGSQARMKAGVKIARKNRTSRSGGIKAQKQGKKQGGGRTLAVPKQPATAVARHYKLDERKFRAYARKHTSGILGTMDSPSVKLTVKRFKKGLDRKGNPIKSTKTSGRVGKSTSPGKQAKVKKPKGNKNVKRANGKRSNSGTIRQPSVGEGWSSSKRKAAGLSPHGRTQQSPNAKAWNSKSGRTKSGTGKKSMSADQRAKKNARARARRSRRKK